jgi:hypothetical protein
LGTDANRMRDSHFLDDPLDMSPAVQAIDQLRFSFSLVNVSDEATLGIARHLLDCYTELLSLSGEQI